MKHCVIVRNGVRTEVREGMAPKEEGTKGGVALGRAWNQACVWHTSPPVDPRENVTLMNLKPRTGYDVRVQLSRPGDGGEGAWGPSTLMTTDCPGEEPRYILSCSLRVSCHAHPEYDLVHLQRPLPFPVEFVLALPSGDYRPT